jgi:hypothetical protein
MRTHRLTLTGLISIFVLVGTLALVSAPALATKTRIPLSFSPFGSTNGISSAAVDQATGNLYVLEQGQSGVVDVFGREGGSPAGGAPAQLTGASTPGGGFALHSVPSALAVDNACYLQKLSEPACAETDPSNSDIYVPADALIAASGNYYNRPHVVDKFRLNALHEYEYVCQFTGYTPATGKSECLKNTSGKEQEQEIEFQEEDGGISATAVDDEGNVYIAANGAIYEFTSRGEAVTSIASALVPNPDSMMVDSTGDIYLTEFPAYVLTGLKRSSLTGAVESEIEVAPNVTQVALDQATGRLFTIGFESSIVSEYNQNGELQLQFSLPEPLNKEQVAEAQAIAVSETSNIVYVPRRITHEGGDAVDAFGPPVNSVLVTTEGISDVGVESAVLSGSLNPQGQEAGASFEYGTSPSLGLNPASSVLATPSRVSGESFVPVTGELKGLEPNQTYYYQLVGTNTETSFYGEVKSFTTSAIKPLAVSLPASFVNPHDATIDGTVNPEHSDTHYHFLFGTTMSYGTSIPAEAVDLGSHYGAVGVERLLEGLASGTTYHYALVASNAQGTVQSADMTFTTPTEAQLVPVAATGAVSEVSPNSATIFGTVGPGGIQTSYEFDIGTDTTYGSEIFGEAGSGAQPETFTVSLQGLAAGTLYHYRILATNKYGTVYGADETFTTPGFPTALLVSPVGAPLVPTPVFSTPSTAGVVTVAPPKAKRKAKAKRKVKRKPRSRKRGHKASSARGGHGGGGSGR